jgi:hypothetical protein
MIDSSRILLVEGSDDLHVISSLLMYHGVPQLFDIQQKGGIERILELLPVQLKATGIERLGISVDADEGLQGRWNAIRRVLESAGYHDVPTVPFEDGTIVDEIGHPRVGVWLMPNNRLPGMLEDFARYLIPTGDPLGVRAATVVAAIPPDERRFSDAHDTKAYIHTWLAWQEDPGTPMGLAITKRYLNAEAAEAVRFIAWLEAVFVH